MISNISFDRNLFFDISHVSITKNDDGDAEIIKSVNKFNELIAKRNEHTKLIHDFKYDV